MQAHLPPNEHQRLLSLKALNILDTDPEQSFDDLVRLAAYICKTPYALIGFIDESRQWYKAKLGVERNEIERELSFCNHALLHPAELTYTSDARTDPRFADNPAVQCDQGLRLYAGVPLLLEQQYAVGTLCVFDHNLHPLTPEQLAALQLLANQVVNLLKARLVAQKEQQQAKIIQAERDRFGAIIESTAVGTWAWNIQTGENLLNERWAGILGYRLQELEPFTFKTWQSLIHPDDKAATEQLLQQHFQQASSYYDTIYRMRHKKGHWVSIHARGQVKQWTSDGQPLLMYCTNTDITDSYQAEQELAQTKSLLQAVIDSSIEAALIATNLQGEIWLFNTGAERMLGYRASELLGKNPVLFHKIEEIQHRQQQIQQLYGVHVSDFDSFVFTARQSGCETLPWTYLCKDGSEKQVRVSVSQIYAPDGSTQGYLGVATDITQLKQLNQALQASEQRYRSMLENLPGVMYRCKNDEFWSMLFISDEVSNLTGFQAYQFLYNQELNFASLYHPDDTKRVNKEVQHALQQQQRFSIEYRLKHKDGSWRWVQELGQGIFDQQGELLFIDGFIWDVTVQHEAIQALSDSEQKLSSLYQLAPVAIVLHNLTDGSFIEANPEFFRLYQPETTSQSTLDYPALIQSHYQHWRQDLLRERRFGPIETELQSASEQRIPVTFTSVLMETSSGQQQIWTLLQDLTEQRRIEQMKNQFVSTVSHELRTPLTSICGSLGLLSGGALGEVPAAMQTMLEIAKENGLRLNKLINDLLDIDKLAAGKMHLDLLLCDVPALLNEAQASISPYAEQYQVQFHYTESEPAFILVDPLRFIQIMANLLSNAAKFSPSGSCVELRSGIQNGRYVIEVLDQGPGIHDEFAQRIFQKFSQADSADSRHKEGSGLGLAIAKELTEYMNGHIGFYNRAEGGCSFYVSFAVATTLPQSRILVVEPDSLVAEHMMQLLQGQHYVLDWARTLAQATKALHQHSYQAITLDLNLPDGHGSGLFEELRQLGLCTPVLIINSAYRGDEIELSGGLATLDWLEDPGMTGLLLDKLQYQLFCRTAVKPRILHIEDDPHLSQILQIQLAETAYCQQAVSLAQAKALLSHEQFDLVILDIGLPDGSGLALLPELATGHPDVPVVIWSAQELSHEERMQVNLVLAKSRVDMDTVLAQIKALLASRS